MSRPLRINMSGGWYHVTARGQQRRAIYLDQSDRRIENYWREAGGVGVDWVGGLN